jgi:tetratricopeptide (TPR) repeat protein
MTRIKLYALLLAPTLAFACAKEPKQTDSPELELPPEAKVADKSGKARDGEPDAKPEDEKIAAKKLEPVKPTVVHPEDRDQNKEKAKMKRSREKSAKAKQLLRSGQNDQAIAEARNALRDHEQNVEAMLVIAEAFYKQGKHELVQSVSGSILKVDAKILSPEEKSQAYNLMGFAYLQAGKRVDAFTAFKNAAETDANNASAWNNLGVQYMWRGDSKTAESCFEYSISLDAKFAEAQLNWGAALRANGKLPEAEAAFRQASKLRPNWAEIHFNLGVLYLDAEQLPNLDEIGRLDAAIAEFEKYKTLVGNGGSSLERSSKKKRGASDAMGNELVSVAQADLYIKAANKGIESEERRKEREQKRKDREAEKAADGTEDGTEDEAAAEPGGDQPAAAQPQKPGGDQPPQPSQPAQPQKPGGDPPSQPSQPQPAQPQKPGGDPPSQPSQPAQPQKPPPSQPAQPQKPGGDPPSQPAQPKKPVGDKPAVPPPSEKPQAPSQPKTPSQPQQPQKPKTQKPGG